MDRITRAILAVESATGLGAPLPGNPYASTAAGEAMAALAALSAMPVSEAGRVFSAANEQTLRTIAQAINALLAQVQQAPAAQPVAGGQPGAPAPGAAPGAPVPVQQSADGLPDGGTVVQEAVVPVTEASRQRGLIKVIDAGWGSSGFYGRPVLERDAATAFPTGTKMFWDHPDPSAPGRPERSLRDLAAETTGPARWMDDGPQGPGVYAPAKVFSAYAPAVEELKDHIGVSIRAGALVSTGTAEGRTGPVIQRLLPHATNSIDFVTIPGRGGRVASLFEAARGRNDAGGAGTTEGTSTMGLPTGTTTDDTAAKLAEAIRERDTARTAAAILASGAVIAEALSKVDLPGAAKAVITERLSADPPMKDGVLDKEALTKAATEAATKEAAYIAALTGKGEVRGMGSGTAPATGAGAGTTSTEASEAALEAQFVALGLSESAAKVAAAGRR
jgi:hypothetical protein